ncbi:MAG TPA: acyl-CoA dehydrogenase family protein [Streptosporangiaceae bacterium]|nr:acyl-CoA dehydrogenase family protein [Streptosporangiaceae bacterium]
MSMTFTAEQDEFRTSVRRFLEQKSSPADVRRLMETDEGYDPAVWRQMAEQLGLQGLALPEEYGGSGYGFIEQIAVLEEMGRALLCAPYLSSVVLAGTALVQSGDDAAKRDLLPGIADGSAIATLAWVEDLAGGGTGSQCTTAQRSGDGYTIDGRKTLALDGHVASLILVVAQADDGSSLFAVDGSASGLTRRKLETLDMTRKVAALEFAGTPARLIADEGAAAGILERTLQLAAVALAAEQVGAAQKCLDMSVEYAKLRVQFGRPIGSFQAIKHKCADMLLEVESARSAAYYAAWAAADGSDELPLLASLAKACCSDAFASAATENIQIHGGIGFTWEHDAHLYYRRAKSTEQFLGSPSEHRDLLAQRLLHGEGVQP